ncbi:aldose reductase A-like [Sycon ciliatum]|uniref:aldose reductase A-like n=1 Tax=Sycon ciliatum TaxID=27933 RepID=UPI0031F5FDB7
MAAGAVGTTLTLANSHKVPALGFGTWLVDADVVGKALLEAAEVGYRHFDCAERYQNQRAIGKAFQQLWEKGYKREDFFITSKLWCTRHDKAEESCCRTLADLQLEYLDLYLVHFPEAFPAETSEEVMAVNCMIFDETGGDSPYAQVTVKETWAGMETVVDKGLARSIGISNFAVSEIQDLLTYARIRPAVNQVELHPYNSSPALVEYCAKESIVVTGYTSLANPYFLNEVDPDNPRRAGVKLEPLMQNEKVLSIGKSHGKTAAQVLLRWGVQRGCSVLIRSLRRERLQENAGIFDFELTSSEMETLSSLNRDFKLVNPPWRRWPKEA